MKRVLTVLLLSWLLASASGCCCCGPYLCAVGRSVFGPWHCGHRHGACCGGGHHTGCCDAPCGDPCGYDDAHFVGGCGYGPGHGHCGDACGYGHAAPCGCCDSGCGCGDCSWYHTGCHSCCGCWGCGDVYLTDLFHPVCDPCWNRGCWHGRGHYGHGCGGGCHGGHGTWDAPGHGDCGCGGPCGGGGDDWGPHAAAPRRAAWMADGSSISAPYMTRGPQAPSAVQRPYVMQRPNAWPGRPISAQATRAPWETPAPSRGQGAMNREFVVSQPKVVDDRVVESRPKTPSKKTVQSSPATGSINR